MNVSGNPNKASSSIVCPEAVGQLFKGNARMVFDALTGEIANMPHAGLFGNPHRLCHFLAQVAHESVGLAVVEEIWGPTLAQRQYENNEALGNTLPGDGFRYKGRGLIQLTGKANYAAFNEWLKQRYKSETINTVEHPERLVLAPHSCLSALWFWDKGNPTGRSLNKAADENDIEMITRRINGGLNGYAGRLAWYDKIALAWLGFPNVATFQKAAKLNGSYKGALDGVSGPKTRAALHFWLLAFATAPNRVLMGTAAPIVKLSPVECSRNRVLDEAGQSAKGKVTSAGVSASAISSLATAGVALAGADWRLVLTVAVAAGVFLVAAVLFRSRVASAIKSLRDAV